MSHLKAPHIFLHIPKTGGTTLGNLLQANFSEEDFGWFWTPPEPQMIAEFTSKRCLIGHFPYGTHALFAEPCTYVVVLRNPYERVLSQYFYNLAEPSDPYHALARDNPLEDWLDLHPDAHDLQVQFLSGRKGPPPDQTTLKLAADHLCHCGVVGILEAFESTLFLLQHHLGLQDLSYTITNQNPNRPPLDAISSIALEKIQRYNKLDLELYRLAQKWLSKQLLAAGIGLENAENRR